MIILIIELDLKTVSRFDITIIKARINPTHSRITSLTKKGLTGVILFCLMQKYWVSEFNCNKLITFLMSALINEIAILSLFMSPV